MGKTGIPYTDNGRRIFVLAWNYNDNICIDSVLPRFGIYFGNCHYGMDVYYTDYVPGNDCAREISGIVQYESDNSYYKKLSHGFVL